MHRRKVIVGLLAVCGTLYASVRRAAAWDLFTQEEINRESTVPHDKITPFAVPQQGAPIINVEEPDSNKPIKPPVTIRITFQPQGTGTTIDRSSFRAKYGWFGLDITQRILEHAQLSASGLVATNVNIPPGSYRITLEIADDRKPPRVGVRTFDFTVV
jgi:hypothetical protein